MTSALLLSVVGASLVGSLHCAGMCGGFVAFYAGEDDSGSRSLSHLAYHGGRLLTYTALGAVAGTIGAAVDLAGNAAGVGRVAAIVAGTVMIVWGLSLLLESAGVRVVRFVVPKALERRTVAFLGRLRARPPKARALLLGLSSTLLPCGWLYAFAVTAAGTGSTLGGAMVMAAFWSGTVPLLLGLGLGVQRLSHHLRRHVPMLSAAVLLVLGLYSVLGRANVLSLAARYSAGMLPGGVPTEPACCHHGAEKK